MEPIPHLPPDGSFELELRKQHLQELRNVDIPPSVPRPLPPGRGGPSPYEQLVEWSKQAKDQIAKAVSNRVVSPEKVDWNNELFTLLESAAAYLRDTDKVFEAVMESRKRTDEGDERALQLLYDSQADIKKIAAMWGLNFEVICDLLEYSPEGHSWLNGPYCGVFFSKDTEKPFLGLAFKGTGLSWAEILKDLKFALMMAAGNVLWGSPIHTGFYQTMFLKFPHIDAVPLDYIKNMIDTFLQTYPVPTGLTIDMHTTGHSLGAAYATLCYGELMRLYNNEPTWFADGSPGDTHAHLREAFAALKARQFVLRDLYTFGCPRLGGVMENKDWARSYQTALRKHEGRSWRVINGRDPVTMVPPVVPLISTWNHVDNGYELDENKAPEALPTEVGTQPSVRLRPDLFRFHSTARYFENLYNVTTTGPKIKFEEEESAELEAGEVTAENAGELGECE